MLLVGKLRIIMAEDGEVEVANWLKSIKLGKYTDAFLSAGQCTRVCCWDSAMVVVVAIVCARARVCVRVRVRAFVALLYWDNRLSLAGAHTLAATRRRL